MAASEKIDKEIADLLREAGKMAVNLQNTVSKFRKTADYLDEVWKDCRVANVVGNGAGVVGGILTIGAGVVTVLSAGTASLLVFTGMAVGAVGAGINVGTSCIESSINSSKVEEAERAVKEVMDTIEAMKSRVQNGKMLYLTFLTLKTLGLEVDEAVINVLYAMLQYFGGSAVEIGAETVTALATTTTQAAGQASFKLGANTLRKIMVGTSAAFVVLDALSLGFTVRDLIRDKKSEAAKCLRQKATEMEALLSGK